MKTISNISAIVIRMIVIAALIINLFFAINNRENQIMALETSRESLETQITENNNYYTETIKEIVKTVQVTDSYLFVGGLSQEETAKWNIEKYEEILTMKSGLDEMLSDTSTFFSNREKYLNEMPNIWPLQFSNEISLKSAYGDRYSPITGKWHFHNGIDLFSAVGAKIIATADGIIRDNWIMHNQYGRWVVIDHSNGLETWYAHMSKVFVREGQKVKKGDVIGIIGSSGASTGIHIHYSIKKNGEFIDPILYIRDKNLTKKE